MKIHDEKLDRNKLRLSHFVVLILGFAQAVIAYVMSDYFSQASGTQNVGFFYAFSYLVFLVILLNLHKLVRWLGKANVFYFSHIAKLLSIIFLIFHAPSKVGAILLMLYIIASQIEWVALDVIIESFSVDRMSGRIRGLHLTIMNAGYLFGPLISAYVLTKLDFQGIFIFALIFNIFVFIFSIIGFRHVNHKFEQKLKVWEVVKKVMARKNILRIYYISFVLEFFYALMVIYTPLYLLNLGYSWEKIGIIFTVMLVPFVLVQYPMGALADKKIGEKEALIFSVFIMSVSTVAVYFIGPGTVFIWSLAMFATRIGAALIEILRDSYFFKRIDAGDVDMINFFRAAVPVANIAAAVLSSFILFLLPIKFIFILVGVVVFSALYPALKLTDNKCEAELAAEASPPRAKL